ncbi:hypothetical protein PIIN_10206 [Serendipita indica DSM 11827]|uniref:5'-nucleotidase n=1 Tax=Serendipita indica (strain DSM 11827) TaxID=1109443 RepID=G4TY20_SERID|nr:hypothetical protein PIIN_10206 [Serendipita indica DSM 11827]
MAALSVPSIPPPKSELPYPPIHRNAKFVILSDWDDLTDNYGFGNQRRRELNLEILDGKITFRDAFRDMLASIPLPFEECKEILKRDIKLDPGFAQFYAWCKSAGIPFVIVSSGMEPLIRAVLINLIGEEDAASIDIISNDVMTDETGRWRIKYRHPDRRVLCLNSRTRYDANRE